MYSSGESDILHLVQDVRPEVGAQGFAGHQLDPSPQQVLEQEGERHEVVEGLLRRFEFDQQIHVAVRTLLLAHEGAEQSEPLDAESPNRIAMSAEDRDNVVLAADRVVHHRVPLSQ